ncbi:MAG: V-type ATP synthase subunit E [Sphaerochaetaceae bacterium]|nr:V-type ATP synthase subunit E [Sphaerochaetaceae bacterium]
MEIQIQDLVQSIKRDGIEEAKKEADAIIAAAKAQAAEIVEASKAEAAKNVENAKREIESSRALIQQAERDAILSVRKDLGAMLDAILADKVSKGISEASLAKLIMAAMNGDDPSKYEVEINEVKAGIKAELANEISKGLVIKPVKGMSGMKLCCKDGSGFYDFSDEEIADLLKPFLGDMKI